MNLKLILIFGVLSLNVFFISCSKSKKSTTTSPAVVTDITDIDELCRKYYEQNPGLALSDNNDLISPTDNQPTTDITDQAVDNDSFSDVSNDQQMSDLPSDFDPSNCKDRSAYQIPDYTVTPDNTPIPTNTPSYVNTPTASYTPQPIDWQKIITTPEKEVCDNKGLIYDRKTKTCFDVKVDMSLSWCDKADTQKVINAFVASGIPSDNTTLGQLEEDFKSGFEIEQCGSDKGAPFVTIIKIDKVQNKWEYKRYSKK